MSNKDKSVATWEQPQIGAASLRAPLRGEVYPIDITNASQRFYVPAEWKGQLVRIQADGGDLGVQVATDKTATASLAARSNKTAPDSDGCITVTAVADGVFRGVAAQWLDVQFPSNAVTFAIIGSAATGIVARCHLAET